MKVVFSNYICLDINNVHHGYLEMLHHWNATTAALTYVQSVSTLSYILYVAQLLYYQDIACDTLGQCRRYGVSATFRWNYIYV